MSRRKPETKGSKKRTIASTRKTKPAGKAKGAVKPKATTRPKTTAMARGLAMPAMSKSAPAMSRYDLVCPDDGKLAGGLEFAACMRLAREHNDQNPGHEADCKKQKPSIAKP